MAIDVELDVQLLKSEIKKTYASVSQEPDKEAVFAELSRVLRPGGRMQIADVTIQNPVSEEGRRNIDLWTG